MGLYRISESVSDYVYLILISQAFLNKSEDAMNRRVSVWEDIKHYQDTLNEASRKVDYSMEEGIYMLPSNMKLTIRLGITTKSSYPMVCLVWEE